MSAPDKARLFTMRTVRLLSEERRVTEDRIPAIVEEFMNRDRGDSSAGDFLNRSETQRVMADVLTTTARAEIAPDAAFLVTIIRQELPALESIASEYERIAEEIDRVLSQYGPDTVWDLGAKLYNESRSPAALLPVAVMAIQRPARGNWSVFMRARDVNGNIVVPPGEGVDVVFRSTAQDNDETLLESLVEVYESGSVDFKVVFQYLDGGRIESAIGNFSMAISESLRNELRSYAEGVSLTNDAAGSD